jgi:CHASE2 domain-containing sensor protein/signal transduction histidine kinase
MTSPIAAPAPRSSLKIRHVALREWSIITIIMLLLAAALGWQNGLGRLDQTLYDFFISLNGRPARDDIIIVAIDEYSLSELGRWPWPRATHAALLQKINQAKPRSIGLDIIFSEPELSNGAGTHNDDDALLAKAMAQNKRTVLPFMVADSGLGPRPMLPIPALTKAARSIGHIHLIHDSDGVVRSVSLLEGNDRIWWPHFALALINPDTSPLSELADIDNLSVQRRYELSQSGWQSTDRQYIAFAGNSGHFRSVPYVSVLRGEVPASFLANKYVLIGPTAHGLGDAYPTPVSGNSGSMAGVEINANILAGLLDNKFIAIAQPWQTALFCMLPVLLALLGYLLLPPRFALLVSGMLLLLTVLTSDLALQTGLWLAPSAAIIILVIAYPLWSWRRLEAAIAYLDREFVRLDQEPRLLPDAAHFEKSGEFTDALERRINAMENAVHRVRDLRQFVSDSLDNLPDTTIVTTIDGRVLLANKAAYQFAMSIGFSLLTDSSISTLLSRFQSPQPIDQALNGYFEWQSLFDARRSAMIAEGVAARDAVGRDLLVKSAPCYSSMHMLTGWIVNIIDISTIRSAERSRDDTLRFLSHDMRAPQASILALLELQNNPTSALPQHEFFGRIEKATRKTLGLADNFVHLARAESQDYRLEEVAFQDMMLDAIDEMWMLAKNKQIQIVTDMADDDLTMNADRALMTRALGNLLSNAINYSPEQSRITCTASLRIASGKNEIICSISDQGYGIAPADQAKLFRRFQRIRLANQPTRHDGIGLGLVFVKTVIERHQGQITFVSQPGTGTTFTIALPRHETAHEMLPSRLSRP